MGLSSRTRQKSIFDFFTNNHETPRWKIHDSILIYEHFLESPIQNIDENVAVKIAAFDLVNNTY